MEKKEFNFTELWKGIRIIVANGMAYKSLFIGALALTIAYSIVNPIDTYLIGRFIDALGRTEYLTLPIVGTVATYLAILAGWFVALMVELILSRYRIMASLKLQELARTSYIAKMMGHIFRLPISYHRSVKIGEVQEKITTASGAIGSILGDDITAVLPQFVSTLIFLAILFYLNHLAFAITLVAIVAYIYASIILIRPTISLQRQSQAAYAKVRGIALDSIINIKIIKDFVAEAHQTEVIRAGYQDGAMPIWYRIVGLRRTQNMVQNVIIICARACILILSIYLVREGLWTIGSLVIANGFLGQVFTPISSLSNNWRNIQNGIIALEDTERILNLPQEAYPTGDAHEKHINGQIIFDDVSFSYQSDQPVLEHISFSAEPGEIIALVGESGVGKSTLIDLISGYHFPLSGLITVDSVPITEVSLPALRAAVGVVTQEITLFNDTIMNNIRFGNFKASDGEVREASRKAHCDFIERFPQKWEQVVGERGLKLSVGQKQRVAIARAILKDPRILILDEPTSALDAGSEQIIIQALDELMKGKTTFVVAHRLSTVRRADKILVFKGGKIVESGKHDELIKVPDGEYRRLYELQIGLHA